MKLPDRFISCRLYLILALSFTLSSHVFSQVTIVPGTNISLTPLQFVETYLVGTGVTVSNAMYNGSASPLNVLRSPSNTKDQIGNFTASGAALQSLGLAGGIMLSSGKVQHASKAVLPGGLANFTSNSGSDPDLTQLAGIGSEDKSILEFDFVPLTDVVSFRYVFASEEFDAYCYQFNDAFGFFINGPGIPPGPYGGAQNIAYLPETIQTVTINNICVSDSGSLSGVYSWWNGDGPVFNYNRFTHVYTASIGVVCSQTYHLKLAVGDAFDKQFDTGIFLEQNSFSSNNFTGSASFSNPLTGQNLVEGCSNAELVYEIPAARSTDLTIALNINGSGTAAQADILPNPFPTTVVIPAGQLQSAPISIVAVADGLPEPAENLVIDASTTVCSITNLVTHNFHVNNYDPFSVSLNNVSVCLGMPVSLNAVVSGGQPFLPGNDFHYTWSNGETTSSLVLLLPAGQSTYTVTVTDACGQVVIQQATVDVLTNPGPAGTLAGISSVCTPATGLTYNVPVIPGAVSYLWTLPAGAVITSGNNTNSITVDFTAAAVSGNISVKGHSDACGDGTESSMLLTFNASPEPAGPISGTSVICQGAPATTFSVAPLLLATDYDWTVPAGVTIVSGAGTKLISCLFTVSAVSGNITVRGHNADCGYGASSSLFITVNQLPGDAGQISGPPVICTPAGGQAYAVPLISGATSYLWTLPAGVSVASGNNTNAITADFTTAAVSGNMRVRGHSNDCGDGAESFLPLTINPAPESAGNISGPAAVCQGAGTVSYSIDALDFTTDYDWIVPPGVTIVSGAGTSLISCQITPLAVSGTISVRGHNPDCGDGSASSLPVTVNSSPGDAGPVTGPQDICTPAAALTYSVPVIPGADSYIWTMPPGVSITSGINTNTITVDIGTSASSGNISVKGHSIFCGDGAEALLPLTINPSPSPAGTISGAASVCQGQATVVYSIVPLNFTTDYDWTVPPGVAIISGAGTSAITCQFTTTAVSGNITVRGHNAACGYGLAATLPVTVVPLPGDAGTIASASGAEVCQGETGVGYVISSIPNATDYIWTYTGTGAALTNNGTSLIVDFSSSATSGMLLVKGHNPCGDGVQSPLFPITVKAKPEVIYSACHTIKTTKNGRPIILKGGSPTGSGGVYSGTGVFMMSPGQYVFDPSASAVIGGTATAGSNNPVTYNYTNSQGCSGQQSTSIAVFQSNENDPCPGMLTDHRDGKTYPTFLAGSGANLRCWMAANLDHGTYTDHSAPQTDNCAAEKYCENNQATQCGIYGGNYQWGEVIAYNGSATFQDICPAGWHLATSSEWDQLITGSLGNGIAGSTLKDMQAATGFHGLTGGISYLNSLWAFTSGTITATMFWTSDALADGRAVARGLNSINPSVSSYPSSRANAFSVRCVRN
jgi:uncharacterized protein (TIGR02145 family)